MSQPPALCVGILVADVFVPPLERLPAAGELVATGDFLFQPGGCAANAAIVLGKLGVRAAVCGRVGDDVLGDFVERDLRARGIDTSGVIRTAGHGTSKTVIVPVVGEDRRYIHTFGANAALTAADIAPTALDAAEVLYVGGYLILPALREDELAARLLEARARGTTIVLDVAVPAGQMLPADAARTLLPLADYFVPNVDEAFALTGETDPHRQAELFLEHGAERRRDQARRPRRIRSHRATRRSRCLRRAVDVVEPSGAGDAFAAGLMLGILEGWELERAVRFASVIGGSACTALGCWAGVFSRARGGRVPRCASGVLMALVPLTGLLADARAGGYAVGYFEAWDGYSLEAVLEAAEAERAPVILGFGCLLVEQGWLDAGGIETLGALGRAAAERSRVPVALLLNEAHTLEHALRGARRRIQRGDALLERRRRPSPALSRDAHARGIAVEGELGTLPDADDATHASLTDPDEAAALRRGDRRRLPRGLVRQRPRARGTRRAGRPRPARRDPPRASTCRSSCTAARASRATRSPTRSRAAWRSSTSARR